MMCPSYMKTTFLIIKIIMCFLLMICQMGTQTSFILLGKK